MAPAALPPLPPLPSQPLPPPPPPMVTPPAVAVAPAPPLEFIEKPDEVRPGDQVVTSGDGGVFPAGLLVGQVAQGKDKRLRVRLSADYERLEFLRVLRSHALEVLTDPGGLVAPPLPEPGAFGPMPIPGAGAEAGPSNG